MASSSSSARGRLRSSISRSQRSELYISGVMPRAGVAMSMPPTTVCPGVIACPPAWGVSSHLDLCRFETGVSPLPLENLGVAESQLPPPFRSLIGVSSHCAPPFRAGVSSSPDRFGVAASHREGVAASQRPPPAPPSSPSSHLLPPPSPSPSSQRRFFPSSAFFLACSSTRAFSRARVSPLMRSAYVVRRASGVFGSKGSTRSGEIMRFRRRARYSSSRSAMVGARMDFIGSSSAPSLSISFMIFLGAVNDRADPPCGPRRGATSSISSSSSPVGMDSR
mmetsp:Transcript_26894/g.58336  ORF Transcript_26894/g.58336 Transcript_26894/m.58336 type:complete len:279 (-) Transcript_26894:101-937(-)